MSIRDQTVSSFFASQKNSYTSRKLYFKFTRKKIAFSLASFALLSAVLEAVWTTKRLTYNSEFSGFPAIAVDESDIYGVYEDYTPGDGEIYFRKSTDGGAVWQSIQMITNTSGISENPQIALNSVNIYIVYADHTPGNAEIYLKYQPLWVCRSDADDQTTRRWRRALSFVMIQ